MSHAIFSSNLQRGEPATFPPSARHGHGKHFDGSAIYIAIGKNFLTPLSPSRHPARTDLGRWVQRVAVVGIPPLRAKVVKPSDDMKDFVVLPRRWVVERTFSWFGRNRRLAKDFENLAETLAIFVYPGPHPTRH